MDALVSSKHNPSLIRKVLALLAGLAVAGITVLFYYNSLQNTLPYFPDAMAHNDPWMVSARHEIFFKFIWPLVLILPLSTASIVYSVRSNSPCFSRWGYFALAWPLIMSISLWTGLFVLLLGIILILINFMVLVVISIVLGLKGTRADRFAILLNVAWFIFYVIYYFEWSETFIW